jgi:hypothetical protein
MNEERIERISRKVKIPEKNTFMLRAYAPWSVPRILKKVVGGHSPSI